MDWATVEWPPKEGSPLKHKSKQKSFIKVFFLILGLLLTITGVLFYTVLKYSDVPWPYPVSKVQSTVVEKYRLIQETVNGLMPGIIDNHQFNDKSEQYYEPKKSPDYKAAEAEADNINLTDGEKDKIKKSLSVSRAGENLRFVKQLEVVATAYTHTGNPTASGQWPRRGVVAVDPNVIPLGTRLYVENYGYATALDTGGAIKGDRIDLFMNTKKEALKWGVRKVKVYILKKP